MSHLTFTEQKQLQGIIEDFKQHRILIVGDVMVDRYIVGSVDRISPEAPVPVVRVQEEKDVLGGAANVANLLASLGINTAVCGITGDDANAVALHRQLAAIGVDDSGIIRDQNRPTTVKTRIVAHRQQVVRVDHEDTSPLSETDINYLLAAVEKRLAEVDAVIISDYGKGVVLPRLIKVVVELCRKRDKIVSVDPKVEHFLQYQGVSLITPNNSEASRGIGIPITDRTSLLAAGAAIQDKLDPGILLITRSEHGMALFEKGEELREIPTLAREVYDVTGAGDIVIAIYTAALISGASAYEAARLANIAAGLEVGKFGCQPVTVGELSEAIADG